MLEKVGEENWSRRKKIYVRYKQFERETPNDLWQIDLKGPVWIEEQGQHIHVMTMIDDHSRFLVLAKFYTRPIHHDDILTEIDRCVRSYGKPRQILTDNGV